eukprot:4179146-Pleurochrysis_carterae.AAC.1
MKVYVIYDVQSAPASSHHKLAITLPAKWLDQSVDKVKDAFINAYNKKFPDSALAAEDMVLQVALHSVGAHLHIARVFD